MVLQTHVIFIQPMHQKTAVLRRDFGSQPVYGSQFLLIATQFAQCCRTHPTLHQTAAHAILNQTNRHMNVLLKSASKKVGDG